jgi:HlyD family secretion protein
MQRIRLIIVASLLALSLAGCTGQEAASVPGEVAALPTTFENVVTASGKVVPARWATLSFEAGGRVEWLVAEGSQVAAGDTLARLDATDLQHAVAQARAALATAQAQLAAAKAGATAEEIAAAEGAIAAAQGGVAAAKATVTQAEIHAEIASANVKQAEDAVDAAEAGLARAQGTLDAAEAGLAQAQGTLDAAEAAVTQSQGTQDAAKADVARAQAELARLQAGARPEEIAAAEAALRQAQAGLEGAKKGYDVIAWQPGADSSAIGITYRQALAVVEQAQAQVDLLKAGATEEEIAAAKAGVTAAQAQVSMAQAGVDAAQAQVSITQAGVDAAQAQVTIAEAGVDAAEAALTQAQDAVVAAQAQEKLAKAGIVAAQAQVEAAEGQLAQAEAQRDRLKAGATEEEMAVLEAQVAQAEAALTQAKSALTKATLVAPFAGTVGVVYPREGEVLSPGISVLVLGDVSTLRVETTDLNEVDVARVAVGSTATLTFDALPERTTEGRVTRIAPMASVGQGGTNFTAIIEMTSPPEELRWGMTAFVDIEVSSP